MGAVTIWPRSLPAPFFFIRPNFFPTLFLDSPRVADCSVPFDFSKRSKEERNWIIAGLFYQEIRKCFLNENIFSQGKKESQQSNQNNIILWVGNRVPCLLKFSKAKKKNHCFNADSSNCRKNKSSSCHRILCISSKTSDCIFFFSLSSRISHHRIS